MLQDKWTIARYNAHAKQFKNLQGMAGYGSLVPMHVSGFFSHSYAGYTHVVFLLDLPKQSNGAAFPHVKGAIITIHQNDRNVKKKRPSRWTKHCRNGDNFVVVVVIYKRGSEARKKLTVQAVAPAE